MSGGKAHGKNRPYQEACRNVLTFRHPKLTPWEGDGIDVPFALPDTQWTCDIALRDDVGALVVALSQNCLFEAKSENREWEKQGLASPNFPVFGNLRQSPCWSLRASCLQGSLWGTHIP